jgi:hypothetical protein
MSQTVTVIFDGQVLRPESPISLEPNQRYVVTIQTEPAAKQVDDGWDAISNLVGSVEAPTDWAAEHDHYLYGTPKQLATDEH